MSAEYVDAYEHEAEVATGEGVLNPTLIHRPHVAGIRDGRG